MCWLQMKAWHPLFKIDELSLETIKRNLVAARATEAAKQLDAKGQNPGESTHSQPCPDANHCDQGERAVVTLTVELQLMLL